jgi:hypothetical protein
MILPELGKERGYISETLFTLIFVSFALVNCTILSYACNPDENIIYEAESLFPEVSGGSRIGVSPGPKN